MKIVKISMELGIEEDIANNTDAIVDYLNNMLYQDPEFFGHFGPENIETIAWGCGHGDVPEHSTSRGWYASLREKLWIFFMGENHLTSR